MQAYPNEPNAEMRAREARERGDAEKTWHVVRKLDGRGVRGGSGNGGGSSDGDGCGTALETPDGDFAFEALIGERIVAVFRHEGNWFAIDAMCSHQGGPLAEGTVKDGCVTCPWHGWQYDLATGTQTINRQPLQETFPVRQNANLIEVLL